MLEPVTKKFSVKNGFILLNAFINTSIENNQATNKYGIYIMFFLNLKMQPWF